MAKRGDLIYCSYIEKTGYSLKGLSFLPIQFQVEKSESKKRRPAASHVRSVYHMENEFKGTPSLPELGQHK